MIKDISYDIDKSKIRIGLVLVFIGILSPYLVNVRNLGIYDTIFLSIENSDQILLIIAAFKLVLLNSLRALPNYLSVFIIAESIEIYYRGKPIRWIGALLGLFIIPFTYCLIGILFKVKYHLGVPAFILIISIIIIEKLGFRTISIIKKSLIMILVLLGVQWMDIIPLLTRYGFGSGEMSMEIKRVAAFFNATDHLTWASVVFFIMFISNSFLVSKLLKDQNDLMLAVEENKRVEKELAEVQLQAVEARTSQEIQSLVHDLKTPLTSIQALVSVSEMMVEDKKIAGYLGKINGSVDKLNVMISEILYGDKKRCIRSHTLFEDILSQLSTSKHVDKITYTNRCKSSLLMVNKVRFSRAIINAINNSFEAVDEVSGVIALSVHKKGDDVLIDIIDNGIGIESHNIDKVWEKGYSTKDSSGIGLQFVKAIIEDHDGEIKITSTKGKGTEINIIMHEVISND